MKPNPTELLSIAAERVSLPSGQVALEYDEEVDTLYLRLRNDLSANRSVSQWDKGVVYDYHGDQLVGIEILDVLEKYT